MDRRLTELRKRYAWFEGELREAHARGKIDSEAVRFFIAERPALLYDEDGEPVLNGDGEPQFDPDVEPIYFGCAQAYSYIGEPPSATVAGQVDVSLEMIDRAPLSMVLDIRCADLSAEHAAARRNPVL